MVRLHYRLGAASGSGDNGEVDRRVEVGRDRPLHLNAVPAVDGLKREPRPHQWSVDRLDGERPVRRLEHAKRGLRRIEKHGVGQAAAPFSYRRVQDEADHLGPVVEHEEVPSPIVRGKARYQWEPLQGRLDGTCHLDVETWAIPLFHLHRLGVAPDEGGPEEERGAEQTPRRQTPKRLTGP